MSTQTAANIKKLALLPSGNYIDSYRFTIATGSTNETRVTIQALDASGATLAGVFHFDLVLSDAATGAGLTATTASGNVTAHTSSGTVIGTDTAKKALRVQTLATGAFTLSITDTAKTGFYVCATRPIDGKLFVSRQLVTADYA